MIALFYAYNINTIQYGYMICQILGILCQIQELDTTLPALFCQI